MQRRDGQRAWRFSTGAQKFVLFFTDISRGFPVRVNAPIHLQYLLDCYSTQLPPYTYMLGSAKGACVLCVLNGERGISRCQALLSHSDTSGVDLTPGRTKGPGNEIQHARSSFPPKFSLICIGALRHWGLSGRQYCVPLAVMTPTVCYQKYSQI